MSYRMNTIHLSDCKKNQLHIYSNTHFHQILQCSHYRKGLIERSLHSFSLRLMCFLQHKTSMLRLLYQLICYMFNSSDLVEQKIYIINIHLLLHIHCINNLNIFIKSPTIIKEIHINSNIYNCKNLIRIRNMKGNYLF